MSQFLNPTVGDKVGKFETTGRVLKPWLRPIEQLVDECKLHVTENGLRVETIDAANVAMIESTLYPEAFDDFEVKNEYVLGMPLNRLKSGLSKCRYGKRTDDNVILDLHTRRGVVEIFREYNGVNAAIENKYKHIEPDSVRGEPDLPELDLPAEATVSVQALNDMNDVLDTQVRLQVEDGDLIASEEFSDCDAVAFALEGVAEGEAESHFSNDYFTDTFHALSDALIDEVKLELGMEFPLKIHYEREVDGEVLYDGTYIQAPRISD